MFFNLFIEKLCLEFWVYFIKKNIYFALLVICLLIDLSGSVFLFISIFDIKGEMCADILTRGFWNGVSKGHLSF